MQQNHEGLIKLKLQLISCLIGHDVVAVIGDVSNCTRVVNFSTTQVQELHSNPVDLRRKLWGLELCILKVDLLSEIGVRLAQKVQVGWCIPVGIQLEKAEVGPISGPTWRVSHLRRKLWGLELWHGTR